MFNIGDMVKCTGGTWFDDVEGLIGTIVVFDEQYGAGIDYGLNKKGRPHNSLHHNLSGKLKTETGYWIREKNLVKVSNKKGNYKRYA